MTARNRTISIEHQRCTGDTFIVHLATATKCRFCFSKVACLAYTTLVHYTIQLRVRRIRVACFVRLTETMVITTLSPHDVRLVFRDDFVAKCAPMFGTTQGTIVCFVLSYVSSSVCAHAICVQFTCTRFIWVVMTE
jgi:hypothetical protein